MVSSAGAERRCRDRAWPASSTASVASRLSRAPSVVVEDREAGRHARLERKALQQALAEGVDRLHLEAARRLDRAREQRAGERASPARSACAPAPWSSSGCNVSARRRRPGRQIVEHAARHLGGGRLGVGEAQDAVRAACRRAAGAARAASARASCRRRHWPTPTPTPSGRTASACARVVSSSSLRGGRVERGHGSFALPAVAAAARPFGDAGEVGVVVVVVGEAGAAHGARRASSDRRSRRSAARRPAQRLGGERRPCRRA